MRNILVLSLYFFLIMDNMSDSELSFPFKCNVKSIPWKRAFDVLFSIGALLFFSPIFLFIYLAVRLSSSGKVVYSHTRIGRGGVSFKCFKFRSMYADADVRLQQLLDAHPEMLKEWQATRKLKYDPRVTPVGNFLRKTSLDELPQFWNVLRGDLSIVGPRPVVYDELITHLGPKASKILSIRPGLTCIWQVSGRSDTSYSKRIQLDEEYIDNHSLLLDLKLIAKTIPSMIFSKGAY
jgi:exopolysaccharide production protein ExoY